mgnify:CR=1 FL=1
MSKVSPQTETKVMEQLRRPFVAPELKLARISL